jgi:UDP-N-acetylglucosamine:LPS N-acetylglucosamine transferase
MKQKSKIVFLCYGEGGHKAEMERLFSMLNSQDDNITYIGLCEGQYASKKMKNHLLLPMRSKYNKLVSLALFPCAVFYNLFKIIFLVIRYNPEGLVSTGPGSVLLPAAVFKVLRRKIVYIETGCRFYTKSLSGRFLSGLADKFYVQNTELLNLYPNAVYGGLL